jgi:hypothetical protein
MMNISNKKIQIITRHLISNLENVTTVEPVEPMAIQSMTISKNLQKVIKES